MARRPGTALPSMFVGNKPAVARPTLAAAVLALSDILQKLEQLKRGVNWLLISTEATPQASGDSVSYK